MHNINIIIRTRLQDNMLFMGRHAAEEDEVAKSMHRMLSNRARANIYLPVQRHSYSLIRGL